MSRTEGSNVLYFLSTSYRGMNDGPGGILFLMEAGGPMWGICRVDEWADGHGYSIDGWTKVVGYYVDGCTKVGGYQIDGEVSTMRERGCYLSPVPTTINASYIMARLQHLGHKPLKHHQFTAKQLEFLAIVQLAAAEDDDDELLWRTWALSVTHEACKYTKQGIRVFRDQKGHRGSHRLESTVLHRKFNAEKTGGDLVIPSPNLDTDLVMACDQLVDCLIKAHKNPILMQINIARYSKLISPMNTGHNEEIEEKLLERYPEVSASLKGPFSEKILKAIARLAAIASAALRVMHPEQYWAGL
ncbi:uncharacterized protein HD556DRAFT_1314889 [Suillus plorans]|uniref:Uncharacterized protein n=1 Tax=Suillus plorans TaxID=116603 RepID=A0A9P7A8W1_9AGAM|nr:uncharacterized protein HD556DRAFT_1314889 [Suillus plorans]KAG1784675.1 hypothetical protein HD556DRAFT_1314889 [Suillus plorans]